MINYFKNLISGCTNQQRKTTHKCVKRKNLTNIMIKAAKNLVALNGRSDTSLEFSMLFILTFYFVKDLPVLSDYRNINCPQLSGHCVGFTYVLLGRSRSYYFFSC